MSYESCIERLVQYFSSAKYQREVIRAREEFFGNIGVNDSESGDFERNLNLFFDWYLFTRTLDGTLLTPAKMALNLEGFKISPEERPYFDALAEASYGLFEYIKTKGEDHYGKDLITGEKLVVKSSKVNMLTPKGSIFSTHFVKDGHNNFFSTGMIFHPVEAKKFITQQIKKIKSAPPEEHWELVNQLTKMYFRLERYPHLNHEQIYSANSAVRF
jgi:hypothetical protein